MAKSLIKKQKTKFVSSRTTSEQVTNCESMPLGVVDDTADAPDLTISTPSSSAISETQKEIFMERFQVELLQRFRFQLAVDVQTPHKNGKDECPSLCKQQLSDNVVDTVDSTKDLPCHRLPHSDWLVLRSCIVVGTNACTKLFQSIATRAVIRLMVMCVDVDHVVVGHLYRLGNHYQIPTIVLPGSNPSRELGRALGIRRVSVMVLCLPSLPEETGNGSNEVGKAVAAFIELVSVYVTRK